MKKILIISVCQLMWIVSARAQSGDVEKIEARFPGENGAFVNYCETIDITVKNGKLNIVSFVESEAVFFNDNAKRYSRSELDGNEFDEISDIEAYSLIPENNKYAKKKVEQFNRYNEPEDNIFYDNSYNIEFYYPGLKKNARKILKYRRTFTDPHILGTFLLAGYLPSLNRKLIIRYDSDIEIACYLFNCESLDIRVTESKSAGKTIRVYEGNNIPKTEIEENAPPVLYYVPHLLFNVCSYPHKGKRIKVIGNLQDLYQWSYGFVSPLLKNHEEELKRIADSLCSGITGTLDKIRRLYYWMQDNIHYVAFEEGYYGFTPRSPVEVLHKRYGDCKDMAILLCRLLRHAGIEAYPGWIGTRERPYKYTEVPSTACADHMITVCYDEEGHIYFLDPTSGFNSVFLPPYSLQGKQVMVGLNEENFRIETIPVYSKETSGLRNEITIKMKENREITGIGKSYATGYFKAIYSSFFANMNADEQNRFVKSNIAYGQNKLILNHYNHSSLTERENPLEYTYDFSLPDYYHQNLDEVYINLCIGKSILSSVDLKTRRLDYENDFYLTITDVVEMEIPEGLQLRYLPAGDKAEYERFGFHISYLNENNKIRMERVFYMNTLITPKSELADWNTLIRKLNSANAESVVLFKSNK